MCHPAYVDNFIYNNSSYSIGRVRELEILTSKEVKDFIKNNKIELINFYFSYYPFRPPANVFSIIFFWKQAYKINTGKIEIIIAANTNGYCPLDCNSA